MADPVPSRVLLLDDHLAFAEALALAINVTPDLRCVATTATPDEALDLLRKSAIDLFVSDQHLNVGRTGIEVVRTLRDEGIRVPTLLLTGYATPTAINEASELGIAIISKSTSVREIVTAMRALRDGRKPVSQQPTAHSDLSNAELQVLRRLGNGERAAEIASALNLSIHTVRDHIKAILRKLNCSSQLEAVAMAQRRGLLAPPT